jgi:hypothetical protein
MKLFLVGPSAKISPDSTTSIEVVVSALKDKYQINTEFFQNMDITLKGLLSETIKADALLLLPGWQKSAEATLVVDTASKLGMPMFIEKNGALKPRIEVIGLSGYARAGKDTIGDYLVELGYERASFAAPIRKALYTLNPYATNSIRIQEVIDTHGWEGSKEVDPEVRLLLQRLGSDVGRAMIDNDIWVDLTLKAIPDGAKIVFTDCRFPNEAAAIKRFGGELWRVSRDGAKPANNHISEIALDDWRFDAYFENNSTIEELHAAVSERFNK